MSLLVASSVESSRDLETGGSTSLILILTGMCSVHQNQEMEMDH